MKRTIWAVTTLLIVFATLLTVLLVRPLGTVKAHRGCSNRTLVGDYGWTEFGLEAETTGAPFWTQTGLVHFDGTGTFSGRNINYVESGTASGPSTETGTYSVDSNCTVSITYTWNSDTYTDNGVVVGTNGSEVVASEYSSESDTTGHVDIKRVTDGE